MTTKGNVLRIELRDLDAAFTLDAALEEFGATLDGKGPLARALHETRAALEGVHAATERLDARIGALEELIDDDEHGVEIELWDDTFPASLSLRIDLATLFRAPARPLAQILTQLEGVLALLPRIECSELVVKLGRQEVSLEVASRELAGRASLRGIVLGVATAQWGCRTDEDDDEDYDDDDDDVPPEAWEDAEEPSPSPDARDHDGFPPGGFGAPSSRRDAPATLHPDESWVLTRLGVRWPCTADVLSRCRGLMASLHPDRAREQYDAAAFRRATSGFQLLRKRLEMQ